MKQTAESRENPTVLPHDQTRLETTVIVMWMLNWRSDPEQKGYPINSTRPMKNALCCFLIEKIDVTACSFCNIL